MVKGPGQKIARARAKGIDHFGGRTLAGQGDHRSPRLTSLRGADHLHPAVRQVDVDHTEVEWIGTQSVARRTRCGSHDALCLQRYGHVLQGCLHDEISVNEEKPVWHAFPQVSTEGIGG
jgi:hypothetical protein